jgi:hypothetical protein
MRSGGKWDVGSGTRPTKNNLNFLFVIYSNLIKMRLHLNKISVAKSVLFPQQPKFFAGLTGKFCQELATLIHLQTGRRNILDLASVMTQCPTPKHDNNLLIYALSSM